MFLLKFETDAGRLYLVSPKRNVQGLNLNLSKPVDSVSFDAVTNLVKNIEAKFKEEPAPEPEKEEPKEEKEPEKKKEKKATIATVIRQYVSTLKE